MARLRSYASFGGCLCCWYDLQVTRNYQKFATRLKKLKLIWKTFISKIRIKSVTNNKNLFVSVRKDIRLFNLLSVKYMQRDEIFDQTKVTLILKWSWAIICLQFFEASPHIQCEPPSWTTSNFPGEDDNRHYQVLLHLYSGVVRLRLRWVTCFIIQPVSSSICVLIFKTKKKGGRFKKLKLLFDEIETFSLSI